MGLVSFCCDEAVLYVLATQENSYSEEGGVDLCSLLTN